MWAVEEKKIETSNILTVFWNEVKVVCCLPIPFYTIKFFARNSREENYYLGFFLVQ